jgi:hypothetical protein
MYKCSPRLKAVEVKNRSKKALEHPQSFNIRKCAFFSEENGNKISPDNRKSFSLSLRHNRTTMYLFKQ